MKPTAVRTVVSSVRAESPSRQVLTLFGDYWWRVPEQIPSGAIVAALGDAGVAEAASRATLSRLTRAGLLVNGRVGRRTTYGLSSRGEATVEAQSAWLESFGRESHSWDGTWSIIAFSVPEKRRSIRHQVRSQLRWLGYAPLHDGLWISPHDTDLAVVELRRLGVEHITALRTDDLVTEPARPQEAWDLEKVAAKYRDFLDQIPRERPRDGAAALRDRMRVSLAWQRFRGDDPGLPDELLPADWPRRTARARFVELHLALAPLAEERVRAHVAAIEPLLAECVTQRRFEV